MPRSRDGRVGQRGERGQHAGQLADVAQVDVDAADVPRRAGAGQPVVVAADTRAHAASRRRSASPGWVVSAGQPAHRHPAAGHQRRGEERRGVRQVRLDVDSPPRSGARRRPARRPGRVSTARRRSRSIRTVIARCGADGTGGPRGAPRRPWRSGRGQQQTGDELRRPGRVDRDRAARHRARAAHRERQRVAPPSSISAPSARRAARIGPIGRLRACGSPSKNTSPVASAATGGTNRMTVPASPTSSVAGPRSSPGVTRQSPPSASSMATPSARSAPAMSRVSRLRSGPRIIDGSPASAARTSARLVIDFDPGSATAASTGPSAAGADHRGGMTEGYRSAGRTNRA